jgi:hypothetical protein
MISCRRDVSQKGPIFASQLGDDHEPLGVRMQRYASWHAQRECTDQRQQPRKSMLTGVPVQLVPGIA